MEIFVNAWIAFGAIVSSPFALALVLLAIFVTALYVAFQEGREYEKRQIRVRLAQRRIPGQRKAR